MKNDRSVSTEYINKLRLVEKYGFTQIDHDEFCATVKYILDNCSPENYDKINDLIREFQCTILL